MKIETTLNIRHYYLRLLINASCLTGRSKGSLISLLLLRLSRDHERCIEMCKQIEYQKRDDGSGYHRFHICLKPGEYEMFLDLRKIFKKSVSLLVAHAIDEYLDEIINRINNVPDNYPGINYAMRKVVIDNVVNWVLSWGVTTKLLSHPLYSTP